jgi:FixJ family two-component response regulator
LTAAGHDIPIVVVTGYLDEGVRARALQSGAVCFLAKPFKKDDLLGGLRSALTTKTNI